MSGSQAAHASYTGEGTQGISVTDKLDEDAYSVFYNENDKIKQLLHSSNMVFTATSGKTGNFGFGSSKTFNLNKDYDLIGDLYLDFKIDVNANHYLVDDLDGTHYDVTYNKCILTGGESKIGIKSRGRIGVNEEIHETIVLEDIHKIEWFSIFGFWAIITKRNNIFNMYYKTDTSNYSPLELKLKSGVIAKDFTTLDFKLIENELFIYGSEAPLASSSSAPGHIFKINATILNATQ